MGKIARQVLAAAFCGIFLFSCIGASADFTLRRNGSGSLKIEYRIAKDFESLGKLDGNERWLPVPVGKADLERSVDRVKGLKLSSFSSREDGKDLLITARLEFADAGALAGFLDSTGQQALVDLEKKRIVLYFPAMERQNPEFREFFSGVLSGYDYSLSFSLPGPAKGRWLQWQGELPAQAAQALDTGFPGRLDGGENNIRFTSSMADLIFLEKALALEISWQ